MSHSKVQTALLSLLRQGLWGKDEVGRFLTLSPNEWLELYYFAQRHTVEGLVFDGLQYLPANLLPPRDLMLKWTVNIDQLERRNQRMNASIKEQSDLFRREGIFPVLLKGQGVAACYRIPNHRVCGDVDWYFEQEQDYRKANGMFLRMGADVSHTAGFSAEYRWNDVAVEHHRRMFDIHNPLCFAFLNRLKVQYHTERVNLEIQGSNVFLPAPILMMVQVNVHILKHLLSFGIGIRQLCDSAKIYQTYHAHVDGQELKRIYQKLGILKWIHLLHAVLVKYIGLTPRNLPFELPDTVNYEWMMKEIWVAGNFGFFDTRFESEPGRALHIRSQSARRVWSNLRRYFKYAPMEVISFPLVQLYSKFAAK